jgi:lactose/L-arabinose transport system permease protein
MLIPVQVVMVPLYIQFSNMQLVDSYWSVILSGLTGAFGVFLMRQSLLSFPKELIEAARSTVRPKGIFSSASCCPPCGPR